MRILVVDPSRVILKALRASLEQDGHEVITLQDGSAALALVRSEPGIDVLITSLELSDTSGLELCWAARSHAMAELRPIFIVAMSSNHSDRRLAEVLDSGADEFILKARSETALSARMRAAARAHARERELIAMAMRDPLTDLYNRRGFFEKATSLCRPPDGTRNIAAAIIDIDRFKSINDTFGHDAGDTVIRRVARHVQSLPGLVGRIGGEEFALMLPDADEDRILPLCESLRRSVMEDRASHEESMLSVTISIGVAVATRPCSPDTVLKRADVGLYRAKAGGRNRTVLIGEDEDAARPARRAHARTGGPPGG